MADAPEGPGLAAGAEFAGYRIEGVLGKGGMGVVYRATKLALDRERALKVIAPALSTDARFRERFKRESRMAAAIEHPNVIPVHDAGEEQGMLYLAMRLVEGDDLHRLVHRERSIGPERTAAIVTGVAAALDAAHAQHLVHRDVKPANVLVERTPEGERVYLTDFGITRTTSGGETLTATGEFVGSVDYIAPEQAAGEPVDARTDVYSLGGVCHFLLTGRPPFPRENSLATLFAHANAPRPRPTETDPSLPAAVDAVIVKAMATDPAERYQSAGELAADLARALGVEPGEVTIAAAPPPAETVAAPTRPVIGERKPPRRLLAAGLIVAALAAVAVVLVLATGGDGEPDQAADGAGGTAAGPVPQPKEIAEIELTGAPNGLTVGEEPKVWVAEPQAGLVEGIDTRTDEVTGPTANAPDAASVAVGHGSIWAVSPAEDALFRLDPNEDVTPTVIGVGSDPSDVAVDSNWVWVANEGSNDVMRIDPRSNEVNATEEVGAGPRSIATGGGSVWVADIDGRNVVEIDARTARRTGSAIPMGSRPNDLAFGEGGVWVIDNVDGTLTRIDPRSQRVGDPVQVGALPRGVKAGFGYVWVANGGDATVATIDPESLEVVAETRVGKDPADIAVGEGSVWTANQGASTVTRLDPGT